MVIGIGAFKDFYSYDKATATYLTVIFLHNDNITKKYVQERITETGVPTAILIHEQDLELLNSTKVNEKVIDIRIKSTEEPIGVV